MKAQISSESSKTVECSFFVEVPEEFMKVPNWPKPKEAHVGLVLLHGGEQILAGISRDRARDAYTLMTEFEMDQVLSMNEDQRPFPGLALRGPKDVHEIHICINHINQLIWPY